MAPDAWTATFLDFAARSRGLVGGVALLLVGDGERADRLAQTVLARRVPASGSPDELLTACLAELVSPREALFEPPWSERRRMELVDTSTAAPPRPPLLDELQRLPPRQRAALVLDQYVGLTAAAAASVLATDVATAELWVRQAEDVLAAGHPERRQPGRLATELRGVVAGRPGPGGSADLDLEHGRRLVRRRWTRRAGVLVAAALVVLLGSTTVIGARSGVPSASGPLPAPTAPTAPSVPRVSALCDVAVPSCQATVMRAWRKEMAQVIASHLDPEGAYFSGYTFSYDPRYESRSFWAGEGGALGLEVYRLDGGATEIYLQVASSYGSATRCGETTGGRCEGLRFMDGNRFTLGTSTRLSRGLEVQHRPDGDQVVTVAARNTTRGRSLEVTRADLIELVQDERLRLPEI